eukprot:TRINITY_DN47236_c0_g1_i1.p1 TRINITY_DN47236_c0_g1~~TRINITY_DN47236_c0_g1_i1.p1  ORF type:complete len:1264 (+),score=316.71 TRINITY_DN47236_c0_g1_i1:54-3845(+)
MAPSLARKPPQRTASPVAVSSGAADDRRRAGYATPQSWQQRPSSLVLPRRRKLEESVPLAVAAGTAKAFQPLAPAPSPSKRGGPAPVQPAAQWRDIDLAAGQAQEFSFAQQLSFRCAGCDEVVCNTRLNEHVASCKTGFLISDGSLVVEDVHGASPRRMLLSQEAALSASQRALREDEQAYRRVPSQELRVSQEQPHWQAVQVQQPQQLHQQQPQTGHHQQQWLQDAEEEAEQPAIAALLAGSTTRSRSAGALGRWCRGADIHRVDPSQEDFMEAGAEPAASSRARASATPSSEPRRVWRQWERSQVERSHQASRKLWRSRRRKLERELEDAEKAQCTFAPQLVARRSLSPESARSNGPSLSPAPRPSGAAGSRCGSPRYPSASPRRSQQEEEPTFRPSISPFARAWSARLQDSQDADMPRLSVFERLYRIAASAHSAKDEEETRETLLVKSPRLLAEDNGLSSSTTLKLLSAAAAEHLYEEAHERKRRQQEREASRDRDERACNSQPMLERSRQYYWQMLERQVKVAFDLARGDKDVLLYPAMEDFLRHFGVLKASSRDVPKEVEESRHLRVAIWKHLDPYKSGHVDLLTLTVFFHVLLGAMDDEAKCLNSLAPTGENGEPSSPRAVAAAEAAATAAAAVDPEGHRICQLLMRFNVRTLRSEFHQLYLDRMQHHQQLQACATEREANIRELLVQPGKPQLDAQSRVLAERAETRQRAIAGNKVDCHADLLHWRQAQYDRRRMERKLMQQAAEVMDCSFRPDTSKGRGSRRANSAGVRHELLYIDAMERRQQHEAISAAIAEQREALELVDCPFRPNLRNSERSFAHLSSDRPSPRTWKPRGFDECKQRLRRGFAERSQLREVFEDRSAALSFLDSSCIAPADEPSTIGGGDDIVMAARNALNMSKASDYTMQHSFADAMASTAMTSYGQRGGHESEVASALQPSTFPAAAAAAVAEACGLEANASPTAAAAAVAEVCALEAAIAASVETYEQDLREPGSPSHLHHAQHAEAEEAYEAALQGLPSTPPPGSTSAPGSAETTASSGPMETRCKSPASRYPAWRGRPQGVCVPAAAAQGRTLSRGSEVSLKTRQQASARQPNSQRSCSSSSTGRLGGSVHGAARVSSQVHRTGPQGRKAVATTPLARKRMGSEPPGVAKAAGGASPAGASRRSDHASARDLGAAAGSSTGAGGNDEPRVLYRVEVDIAAGRPSQVLEVRAGQRISDAAADFAVKHALPPALAQRLHAHLQELVAEAEANNDAAAH